MGSKEVYMETLSFSELKEVRGGTAPGGVWNGGYGPVFTVPKGLRKPVIFGRNIHHAMVDISYLRVGE